MLGLKITGQFFRVYRVYGERVVFACLLYNGRHRVVRLLVMLIFILIQEKIPQKQTHLPHRHCFDFHQSTQWQSFNRKSRSCRWLGWKISPINLIHRPKK